MKTFFKNKINIFVSVILVLTSIIAISLVVNIFMSNKSLKAPDFKGTSLTDVNNWCEKQKNNPCVIEKEYSNEIAKDQVIYQSIKADTEIIDKITIVISLGKLEIPAFSLNQNSTRLDVEAWASQYNLKNLQFFEESSETVKDGSIIRIETDNEINLDSIIKVYISTGKKDKDKDTSATSEKEIVIKSGTYTNLTVDDFTSKVKTIGLVANHVEDYDDYSSTVSKGNVVWHGSGTYVKDEKISYGISLGKQSSSETISITKGQFVGLTLDEFKSKVTALGLVPYHKADYDENSDTVAKDCIVWNGNGEYVKGENISYALSLGKQSSSETITISKGQFVGLSLDEFKSKVTALGLVPVHKADYDENSATVSKDCIVWNGNGEYVKGENISYALSLGKEGTSDTITISKGQFVGLTVSAFESKAKELNLKPNHNTARDEYSDTIAKGDVVWHGYGDYVDNELFNYGVSLGKQSSSETITISKGQFVGLTLDEFKSKVTALGLVPVHKADYDEYSDTVSKDCIVWNGNGEYVKGENISYALSLGKKETVVETLFLPSFDAIANSQEKTTYDDTLNSLKTYFNNLGFTNIAYQKGSSYKAVGTIVSIGVNGVTNYEPGKYPKNTSIVVTICNEQLS